MVLLLVCIVKLSVCLCVFQRCAPVTTTCTWSHMPKIFFFVLLTVHRGITLANDQLAAQLFYFVMRFLQSSTCFEQRCAHHQEVKLY